MFIVLFRKLFNVLKKENIPVIFAYVIILTFVSSILFYHFENQYTSHNLKLTQKINKRQLNITIPKSLQNKIVYKPDSSTLHLNGFLSTTEKDLLINLSRDPDFKSAVNKLYTKSNEDYITYWDSLWWSVVTFTTVGYGDLYPKSPGGRIVAVFAMILGIGFIGTFMATIATIIIQARTKELRGMKKLKLKNHLIICGYHKLKIDKFLSEFRFDPSYKKTPIVLITNSIDMNPYPDEHNFYFVQGETTDEEVLERACIKDSSKVIVIAESFTDQSCDEKTILTVLLIEEINPDIYTTAEILSPSKKHLLYKAHCNEVITLSEISVKLMVQALQDPGITKVISELVSNSFGQQFHKSKVDPRFIGKTFLDLCTDMLTKEHIAIAIERNGEQIVNPQNDMILQADDEYFYISKTRIEELSK